MNPIYLATYGPLRVGQCNWKRCLDSQPSIGTFRVKGYRLYTNGGFPYAVPTRGGNCITIDLFEIDEELFDHCDHLEGYPRHYDRREVFLMGSKIRPWMYFMPREDAGRVLQLPRIESGDWFKCRDSR